MRLFLLKKKNKTKSRDGTLPNGITASVEMHSHLDACSL